MALFCTTHTHAHTSPVFICGLLRFWRRYRRTDNLNGPPGGDSAVAERHSDAVDVTDQTKDPMFALFVRMLGEEV